VEEVATECAECAIVTLLFGPVCAVGGDPSSVQPHASGGHAGQAPPEDHQVPPAAQGRAEEHP
jgi:hypothetical protein